MMANEDLLDEVSFRGGSRVGWINTSFPLVKLTCNRERLTLSDLGALQFTPDQVVSFGSYGSTFLANGLSIEHNRLDYPARIVFWRMGSRSRVLDEIRRVGFVPKGVAVERPHGMPFRWSLIIALALLWSLPLLLKPDLVFGNPASPGPGPALILAIAVVFVLATAVKLSTRVQALLLAPGHAIGEVRRFLSLLQLVSGAMTLAFGAVWLLGQQ